MRFSDVQVGFFEDYEDDEALEVGISGVDEGGVRRSLSVQRSTYEPEEQDVAAGVDSYNVSTERGLTAYGCLLRVQFEGAMLTLEFVPADAEILGISNQVEVDLRGSGVDDIVLETRLTEVVEWGAAAKRPLVVRAWPEAFVSKASDEVSLGMSTVVRLFQDAEELTVCLDRILSRIGAGADPQILVDYVADRQVLRRVARARSELGHVLDTAVEADAVEKLSEATYRYADRE